MQRDYYVEYFEFLDSLLWDFIAGTKLKYPDAFTIGGYCCEVPVVCFSYLYKYLSKNKEFYSQLRKEGKSKKQVQCILRSELDKTVNHNFTQPSVVQSKDNDDLYSLFYPYRNQIFIYIYNRRQLDYLIPLIRQLNQPVLLVSEFELPDETDLPGYVTAMEIEFLKEKYYSPFLYDNFPHVYHYVNTFDQLLSFLQPRCTLLLEGCHFQQEIIAVISKSMSIPSICIQQGWPSILNSYFRNMQYAYYFTWGNLFNRLWSERNEIPCFVPAGYMYDILPSSGKKYITFFLLPPLVISDNAYFRMSLDFLMQCAVLFPEQLFCVKEHPEYRIPDDYRNQLHMHGNIIDVSNEPLSEIYAGTMLVVSHFSSCLMEGIAHGCIPFVFDPASESRFNPDIENMGLGIIASNLEEAVLKMRKFLSTSVQRDCFLRKMNEIKDDLFASHGKDTRKKMVEYINNIVVFGQLDFEL